MKDLLGIMGAENTFVMEYYAEETCMLESLKTWTCSKQVWPVRRTHCLTTMTEQERWCMDRSALLQQVHLIFFRTRL